MSTDSLPEKSPTHLWLVGGLALLWNAFGALDFVMTQTRNETYMGQFSPEQLDYFYGFPAWVVATWALATWGGVLGCVLLLLRKRWAVPVFGASLVCMLLTTVHNYVLTNGLEVAGGVFPIVFSALIFVVAAMLLVYARRMRDQGVLR